MTQTFRSRWDQRVLWQGEAETVKDGLIAAVQSGADLTGAVLTGAVLTGAVLRGAVLTGAVLTGAVLTGAVLTGAVLTGADLRGADLRGADLTGADLTGAVLTGAVLRGAKNLRLPTGETWAEYLTVTVPALLTAGGQPLESFGPHWDCHTWGNCPMAHAFTTTNLDGVPMLLRPRAEQFIQFFDAWLIPWPLPTPDQLMGDVIVGGEIAKADDHV